MIHGWKRASLLSTTNVYKDVPKGLVTMLRTSFLGSKGISEAHQTRGYEYSTMGGTLPVANPGINNTNARRDASGSKFLQVGKVVIL